MSQLQLNSIRPRTSLDPAPLSFGQTRLWFLDRLSPGNPFYTEFSAFRFQLALDPSKLTQSLNEIVRRHDSLRISFMMLDGQPVQVVSPELTVKIPVIDLRHLPASDRLTEASRHMAQEAERYFDLTRLPLFQAKLIRVDEADYIFTLAMHHIITDGWSMQVFGRELAALYTAFASGKGSPLPPLRIQYPDYAVWQKQRLADGRAKTLLAFWKRQLAGMSSLQLNTDHPHPREFSFRGAHRDFVVPAAILARLWELCRAEGVTSYMALLAGFKVLLYRYTGQDDIVVGSPVANRDHEELEPMIGFFVNTVVMRTSLKGNLTFRELLSRVRSTALDAYSHQELPFETLVEELQPSRDLSRNPLFQIIFQVAHGAASAEAGAQAPMIVMEGNQGIAKFDLRLDFWEGTQDLYGRFEYSTDLFDATTIQRMIGHLLTTLTAAVSNPDRRIDDLPILTEPERRQIFGPWSMPEVRCSVDLCVHEHFERQAEQTPDAIAVKFGGRTLTYADLSMRANQIYSMLLDLGAKPNSIVGLCARRSGELVPAMLGILRAGCAYLPMDPAEPEERLAMQARQAKLDVVLTYDGFLGSLRGHVRNVIDLDSKVCTPDLEPADHVPGKARPDSLAYVMYTSGSTGQPKGVCIPHRGIVRLVKGANYMDLGPGTAIMQNAPLSFDAATLEIWGPLLNGGMVVLSTSTRGASVDDVGEAIDGFELTSVFITSGLFPQFVDRQLQRLQNARYILTGGDIPSVQHMSKLVEHWNGNLLHCYGPTEATTFATIYRVPRSTVMSPLPIGRPIANTRVYVLDRNLQPIPVGVDGELFLGGDGLAHGYLADPALTAEKFIPNPFADTPGQRLYATGDVVRFRPDGNLEFRSRVDNQIKIRGFRVEPGEIQAVLQKHPLVRDSVVTVAGEGADNKRLVAYVAGSAELSAANLRSFLGGKLPNYLIPSSFIVLPALPLSPNGKVDRAALPSPQVRDAVTAAGFEAPARELERQIATIWQQVLQVDRVGVNDNFFELGGHSLLLAQVHSRLQEQLGKAIPIVDLFHYATVRALANHLGEPAAAPMVANSVQERAERQRQAMAARHRPVRAGRP